MKLPNAGYHFARAQGAAIRAAYSAALATIARRPLAIERGVSFPVYSYSGEAMLPEQVASIRAFLRNAGRPPAFTVVSDGTHSARGVELLRSIDGCVAVELASPEPLTDLPPRTRSYLRDHPTGRQLALIMSLPRDEPCLYVDCDVLFFPGARQIESFVRDGAAPALYLRDCRVSADERLFRSETEKANPVNTGVLFLRRPLDWSETLKRFNQLDGAPTFFTNQTLTHLAMHGNAAAPLDAAKFVLQLDDQFIFSDRYASNDIVLRHYVNPVRHKFWTAVLR